MRDGGGDDGAGREPAKHGPRHDQTGDATHVRSIPGTLLSKLPFLRTAAAGPPLSGPLYAPSLGQDGADGRPGSHRMRNGSIGRAAPCTPPHTDRPRRDYFSSNRTDREQEQGGGGSGGGDSNSSAWPALIVPTPVAPTTFLHQEGLESKAAALHDLIPSVSVSLMTGAGPDVSTTDEEEGITLPALPAGGPAADKRAGPDTILNGQITAAAAAATTTTTTTTTTKGPTIKGPTVKGPTIKGPTISELSAAVSSSLPLPVQPAVPRRRVSHKSRPAHTSPLAAHPPLAQPDDEWDYSETEWWGWLVLVCTWLVFVVGMGSCLGIWSWAWDVGETPYAPPELEDDPTLPIVGYYPALIVATAVMAWVWVVVAWVGMKYFRHAKMVGD